MRVANPDVAFAWDERPGMNVEHITANGMTTDDWESIFSTAPDHDSDKDDPSGLGCRGSRLHGKLYRIVYQILDGTVVFPIFVEPITGFKISRRGLGH